MKEPNVAGAFYPADSRELKSAVEGYLAKAVASGDSPGREAKPHEGRLLALVSPHAGYYFSGQVAAHGYKNIGDKTTVIIIGPSHYADFDGASVYAEGSFKTPLGKVRIDERLARSLIDERAGVSFNSEVFKKEHSVEVQLPFLQSALKKFKVVPILMGSATKESFEHLASKLAKALKENEKAVIVASTDLSHYMDYDATIRRDMNTLAALRRLSQAECQRLLASGEGEMCGSMPVLLTLDVVRRLGANEASVFNYSNSGMVTGDLNRVVGYASVGIYRTPLTDADRKELLNLARETIIRKVKTGDMSFVEVKNPRLRADSAVFVTISKKGQLRGCIGQTSPSMPLHQAVQYSAMRSCASDPRFPPMTEQELQDMAIEISILSPFSPVEDLSAIKVGTHGLYLRKGTDAGIFLPQVPVAQGWDRETYLAELSRKAGLPPDAWKEGASIHSFTAEVFSEGQ